MTIKIAPLFKAVEVGHIFKSTEFRKLEQYREELKERIGIADLCIPFVKRFPPQQPMPQEDLRLNHFEKAYPAYPADLMTKDDAFWRHKTTMSMIKNIQKRRDIRQAFACWDDIQEARDAIERELLFLHSRLSIVNTWEEAGTRIPLIILSYSANLFYSIQRKGEIASEKPLRVTI